MGKRNAREAGLGDVALPTEDLESPEFATDREYAGFSINEARKAAYHNLDIKDFSDLDTPEHRKHIDACTVRYIGERLLDPPEGHPAVFTYKKRPEAKTIHRVLMSSTEAILLGRDPQLFGEGAAERAQQRVNDMRHPDFETVPDPPERWRVLQTYLDETIRWQRTVNKRLYDASRYRNSNGEAAEKYDRLNFVKFMRSTVIHPLLDDLPRTAGWDDIEPALLHRIVDYRLFFHERVANRNLEWRQWHWLLSPILEHKDNLFTQAVEKAKRRPDEALRILPAADADTIGAVQ